MKSLATFSLIILISFFVACNQKKNTASEKSQEKEITPKVTDTIDLTKVISHESETIKNVDFSSKLEEKVKRLSQLEHNYLLKSLEVVPPKKTLLLGRLERILKRTDSLSKKMNLSFIKSGIHEIRKSFLKGTKSMQPNGSTYPRVTIEEYIFNNQQSATTAFETLMNSKKSGNLWTYVSKEPSALFLEENKLYFVNTGGYYMMNMCDEIVDKIKD